MRPIRAQNTQSHSAASRCGTAAIDDCAASTYPRGHDAKVFAAQLDANYAHTQKQRERSETRNAAKRCTTPTGGPSGTRICSFFITAEDSLTTMATFFLLPGLGGAYSPVSLSCRQRVSRPAGHKHASDRNATTVGFAEQQ